MEITNLIVGILSLVVNIIMLRKVNEVLKNVNKNNGNGNKIANQDVRGKNSVATINQ